MPEITIPSAVITGLQVIIAFTGAFFVALWLSMIVWTFRDARSRSRDIFAILLATLMVVFFGPLGLILYFLLRPKSTLAELYERSLEEEALLQDLEDRPHCPGCSRQVNDAWIVCPDCHTTLKKVCPTCSNTLQLSWAVCPFCATQVEVPVDTSDHSGSDGLPQTVTQPMGWSEPEAEPAYQDPVPEPVPYAERPRSSRADETQPQIPQTGSV
ncbi:MAG: zinc ribbon domain-containing protein [Anaerolineae bacterium]|nr:zinc ribbon domain-containing protein [Anaerolineae bacterium]MCB9103763.1 zinc ribbon domain-containing protein [Anaerolineales bacterium]